jgi:acyl-CoA synthetase (AMP-forming)/AMP-acid ligase II
VKITSSSATCVRFAVLRKKAFIIRGGSNISPVEVELVLTGVSEDESAPADLCKQKQLAKISRKHFSGPSCILDHESVGTVDTGGVADEWTM